MLPQVAHQSAVTVAHCPYHVNIMGSDCDYVATGSTPICSYCESHYCTMSLILIMKMSQTNMYTCYVFSVEQDCDCVATGTKVAHKCLS